MKNIQARVMVLVHDKSSRCALLIYEVSSNFLKWLSSYRGERDFMMDIWTDALTVGYLFGNYSVRKSSQESVST